MLQYMFAEELRLAIPGAIVTGQDLEALWGIPPGPAVEEGAFGVVCRGHNMPFQEIVALANAVPQIDIYVMSLCARVGYFQSHLVHHRSLFRSSLEGRKSTDRELLINIRRADYEGRRYPDYFPLPLRWYERVIDETGLQPVFLGQMRDDAYTRALRRKFPRATFVEPATIAADFASLRNAHHAMLAIGTFSWLSTWLSETAESIHLPIAGTFHPSFRPASDLLPTDDQRYRFYDTDLHQWRDFDDDLDALITRDFRLDAISGAATRARFPTIGTDGLDVPDPPLSALPGSTYFIRNLPTPKRVIRGIGRRVAGLLRSN